MNRARRWFVGVLGIVLLLSLLGAAYSISFNRTFGSAEKVQKLLTDSKVYDHIVNSVLAKSQEETSQGIGDTSVNFSDPAIKAAANQAFTPEDLEKSVDALLKANFDWLSGKTAQPQFNIDLTTYKQNFAENIGRYVSDRLSQLPACSAEQQAQLQIPIDPLTVNCRPAGLDPQTEGTRITTEINDGNFLSQSVIKPQTLGQDENVPQEPYYQKFSSAPKYFQLGQKAPWLLGLLAILTAVGIIFISPVRRKGWRKTGIILALAGILLIGTKIIADRLLINQAENKVASITSSSEFAQARDNVLRQIEANLTQTNMAFGIIFLVIAIAILVYLVATRDKAPRPPKTKPGKEETVAGRDDLAIRFAERDPNRPPQGRPVIEPGDRPQPNLPPPQKPRRKKPPRLIQ